MKKNTGLSRAGHEKRDLVYIMSHSYSGSTLLTRLMAAHPDISTIGELKATSMGSIYSYKCSCGTLIMECEFWKNVTSEMIAQGKKFSLDKFGTTFRSSSRLCDHALHSNIRGKFFESMRGIWLRFHIGCKRKLYDLLEQNRTIIEIVCKNQGGEIFLDGSKEPSRLKHLLLSDHWNIKIIYLIRDGRGVAGSCMKHENVPMREAAKKWLTTQRGIDNVMKSLVPNSILNIKYEDLCTSPNETLGSIYSFLGSSKDISEVDYGNYQSHLLGNSMRLGSLSEIKLDEKWRVLLTENELDLFESITEKKNQRLGYK